MGAWLSTSWLPETNQQARADFKESKAHGFFNLKLAPTREELCSHDEGDDEGWVIDFSHEDEEEEDESLILGRELRSHPVDWVYDESKSTLENRRPSFCRRLFC
jgi:hypothetical protein